MMRGICIEKKTDLYLNQWPRKSDFPLKIADIRTDICNFRIALLLYNLPSFFLKDKSQIYSDSLLNIYHCTGGQINKKRIILFLGLYQCCVTKLIFQLHRNIEGLTYDLFRGVGGECGVYKTRTGSYIMCVIYKKSQQPKRGTIL